MAWKISWRVNGTDNHFSTMKHQKNNVNLPPYATWQPPPHSGIYKAFTATLSAYFSHLLRIPEQSYILLITITIYCLKRAINPYHISQTKAKSVQLLAFYIPLYLIFPNSNQYHLQSIIVSCQQFRYSQSLSAYPHSYYESHPFYLSGP